MKKVLGFLIVALTTMSAGAETLAVCTVTDSYSKVLLTKEIKKWEGRPDSSGAHVQSIFQIGSLYYDFIAPFNNDISQATISVGHSSGGGIAYDYHFGSDLNLSPLYLSDMKNGFKIICQK